MQVSRETSPAAVAAATAPVPKHYKLLTHPRVKAAIQAYLQSGSLTGQFTAIYTKTSSISLYLSHGQSLAIWCASIPTGQALSIQIPTGGLKW